MNYLNKLYQTNPYALEKKNKDKIFSNAIIDLTRHHYKKCELYKKIVKNLNFKLKKNIKMEDLPMLPARIFKKYNLKSIPNRKVIKKLVSSGTSEQKLSKIYLDKENAKNQIKALGKIMETILGKQRLPMLIIDQNPTMFDRTIFNAKATAIYGFSLFGRNYCYLLNDEKEIDYNSLNIFLKKYGSDKFFVFGFTSMIFEYLIKKLSSKKINSKFKNAVLLHGGGWKKLEKLKISNNIFKKQLLNKIEVENVYNYYGLVEQAGSIFLECKKCACFVASSFSDVLIRDKKFNIAKNGEKGLIQLFSLLPTSYPGHNILTEDIGEIIRENNYKCGIKGKHFLVHGRAKEAEIRGCSDVR